MFRCFIRVISWGIFRTKGLKGSQSPAIRALPENSATSKAPQILFHARVTDLKPAGTCPTKGWFPATTTALVGLLPAFFFNGHGLNGTVIDLDPNGA